MNVKDIPIVALLLRKDPDALKPVIIPPVIPVIPPIIIPPVIVPIIPSASFDLAKMVQQLDNLFEPDYDI